MQDLVRYPSSIAQGFMKYDGWLYLIAIVPYTLGFNDKIWIHNDPWGELLVRLSLWLISIPLLGLLLALFGVLVLIFMIGESAKEIVYQMRVRF